ERLIATQDVANVAEVAQGAGEMAFEDVGVKVGALAAAHGFNEVAEVILTLGAEFGDEFITVGEGCNSLVVGDHIAIGAVPDVADIVLRLGAGFQVGEGALGHQAAQLKDKFAIAVIENANL